MRERNELQRVIQDLRPARLLLIGAYQQAALEECGRAGGGEVIVMTFVEALSLNFSTPFDLVIVTEFDAGFTDATTQALLARLRDVHARRLLVLAPLAQKIDLNALGFTLLSEYPESASRLYGFELKSYKPTPDWLSAQYWANPDMWDKKRW